MPVNIEINTQKDLVKVLLANATKFDDWTLQGFGMLRKYLTSDKSVRLHVWDENFANPGVSQMHTHPWDFHSYVVAGEITDFRFRLATDAEIEAYLCGDYMEQKIRCGVGGGLVEEPILTKLKAMPADVISEGQWYHREAEEIHVSNPEDGTVTLVYRVFREDTEHAYVYWPASEKWITAEPRPATKDEVREICGRAIQRWF